MRVSSTERHCDVPRKVLARTETLGAGLTKYEQRATAVDVVFTEEKRVRKAEGIVHIDGAPPVTGHGGGEDFRTALDEMIDHLRRRLKEQRKKRRDHQAPPLSEGILSE